MTFIWQWGIEASLLFSISYGVVLMTHVLTSFSWIAIVLMVVMYAFLITEKFQRVVVVGLAAMSVIVFQVLTQDQAFTYVAHNLGVL